MGEQTENLLAYLTGRDQPVKAKYREARRSFWAYCKLMNPGFFREDRPHLRELAETLQALEEGKLLAAVNQTLTTFDHPLVAGDEVAFFPPVTGG